MRVCSWLQQAACLLKLGLSQLDAYVPQPSSELVVADGAILVLVPLPKDGSNVLDLALDLLAHLRF
eukprot:SAG11_NODE_666_length_7841_cov_24.388272_4_plen_66_part_00